jgi:hypothetical protein
MPVANRFLIAGLGLVFGLTYALPVLSADTPADPNAPAKITITDKVLRPQEKVPPLGANDWGGCGAVQWAANNFV